MFKNSPSEKNQTQSQKNESKQQQAKNRNFHLKTIEQTSAI